MVVVLSSGHCLVPWFLGKRGFTEVANVTEIDYTVNSSAVESDSANLLGTKCFVFVD